MASGRRRSWSSGGGTRRGNRASVGTFVFALVASIVGPRQAARADEITPMLARETAHADAEGQLSELVAALTAPDQRKVSGLYLAFDSSTTDVFSLPACDDDGDYVVVLTEALLRLAESLALAQATDELRGTHVVDGYGALLARATVSGARGPLPGGHAAPLPAPPDEAVAGVAPFGKERAVGERAHTLFKDLLLWLVAGEVAHVIAGDFTCPHPTAAHEHADETWTPEEHLTALSGARSRMGDQTRADAWATVSLLALGRSESAPLGFLDLLAPVEHVGGGQERIWYLAIHPGSAFRTRALKTAAAAWREAGAP